MLQEAVCAGSNKVDNTENTFNLFAGRVVKELFNANLAHTTCYSTDLSAVSLDIVPFLTLFVWQHIVYFTLEINYFSENKFKSVFLHPF